MESSRGPPRVRNKAAAPVQISAEQLLREAVDRSDAPLAKPTTRWADTEELRDEQNRRRTEFEKYIRINRQNIRNFTAYASYEIENKEFRRARSIMERCIDAGHSSDPQIWVRYIDMELKERNISHARNLLDRSVTILPRVDKLWYKYVYLEESLQNFQGTVSVFERWLQWEPEESAWSSYIKFLIRFGEIEKARSVYERLTVVHPEPRNWMRWAKFEEEHGTADLVRDVFSTAIETLGDDFVDEKIFMAFAKFEIKLKELERARAIQKYALDRLPRSKSQNLHKSFVQFEKQWGDRDGIDHVILSKRRVHYEELIKENPKSYDTWLDWCRLEEESAGDDLSRVRDVYEKAIAQVPPTQEKRHWRRYIYLWLFYAVNEETRGDMERAKEIYQQCIRLIPHKRFTFAKVWLQFAHFLVRRGELPSARKLLGQAIGMCPKDKLFRGYIDLEIRLFDFGRARILYSKYLEWNPSSSSTWIAFAELERGLDDLPRARALLELAVNEPQLDMPELLWKAWIDMESGEGEYECTRALYERLLEKTDHVKVWISWAQFELSTPDDSEPAATAEDDDEDRPVSDAAKSRARTVFTRAHTRLKELNATPDRVALLTAWRSFEAAHGSAEDQEKIEKQMPRKVKKRRKLDDGEFEEYIDYVFPADDESAAKLTGLLAKAQQWKEAKAKKEREALALEGNEE